MDLQENMERGEMISRGSFGVIYRVLDKSAIFSQSLHRFPINRTFLPAYVFLPQDLAGVAM
jgi:hypothetical protein